MENGEIKLDTKLVGQISGDFFIPSYQRGYRWGKNEVERLLDDIYNNGANNYCLQPIVLRRLKDGRFEVIDGQQRLTTIFLIYKFMFSDSKGFLESPSFRIEYETRAQSGDFLGLDINDMRAKRNNNIDFWHITNAYEIIEEWFSNNPKIKKSILESDMHNYFEKFVRVIWYEVDDSENEKKLFARLNIGKIPLTSAELVKALFLSKTTAREISNEKKEEIALQWDNIEKELHNESLWYFLTNDLNFEYKTRIDLVLDLISEKKLHDEKYYTFFYFYQNIDHLEEMWVRIQHTFLTLKDWYENHDFYHKIGYLIASGFDTIANVLKMSQGKKKTDFRDSLDSRIVDSIVTDDLESLSYDNGRDKEKIKRILLLFNVESVRQNGEQTQWFPFDKFKKQNWSLEHIHAQNSDNMRKQEDWKEWIKMHEDSVRAIGDGHAELIEKMEEAVNRSNLERDVFNEIQDEVINLLSENMDPEYIHSIGNLALLACGDNSALSNAVFDVKRRRIISMDQEGSFIPFCTKMTFLKYYSDSINTQIHFWGERDRLDYVNHIKRVIGQYTKEDAERSKDVN